MAEVDKLVAARACNRDARVGKPNAEQICSDILNISIFFDGTGNNRDEDAKTASWANPARMWRSAQFIAPIGGSNYAIYVSGVGTRFNNEATDWIDRKLMKLQDTGAAGGGLGAGGTRRTEFGQTSVDDSLRAVLIKNAKKLNIPLTAYAKKGKPENINGLAAAIEAHGLINIINLSIFGFSRGAALARAFSNDMMKECTTGKDGVLRYKGVPIRLHFMGLFDTVASFGLPSLNVDTPFKEKNLVVPHAIERCVHYVAAHELRFSFPVDLIRKNGVLRSGWTETVYPGAHSDVGGGYEPKNQNILNNYARLPMRDMMREAFKSGVRLVDYDDIPKHGIKLFEDHFELKPEVEASYKQYMAAIGAPATVEQAVTAHMKALYSTWGTMTKRKIKTPDLIEAESAGGSKKGHPGIAREAELLLDAAKAKEFAVSHILPTVSAATLQVIGMKYSMIVRPEKWRLDAWQATASDPVLNFIKSAVHDSKAGFMGGVEPFSYFRPRGMTESSRNVLAQGLDWLDDTVTAIKKGVIKVYHRAEGVVVETWEGGKRVATHTYKVGEKFVVDTVRAGVTYTVEVYQSGKQVVIAAVKRGQQMVITSVNVVKKEITDAATAVQKKAGEVVDATQELAAEAGRKVQSGVNQAKDMATEAGRKVQSGASQARDMATEAARKVQGGASKAAKAISDGVDTQVKAIEDGWSAFRRNQLGF
ncbi:phospholipase effector Tle1 domain-containing protein [Janthinobacterium lividum]|uniref:phospholipase effector Tle1 domain-containing protein n=1 Tax=Janthinobacterium lividum TaxID=29581 RepID=UPI001B83BB38|nr:DUF2235 domain-containing protein [Janthinobacterium lividum]MBR7637187.1 DUF2235 domain-containing protein [Janthinobacterium lividum]